MPRGRAGLCDIRFILRQLTHPAAFLETVHSARISQQSHGGRAASQAIPVLVGTCAWDGQGTGQSSCHGGSPHTVTTISSAGSKCSLSAANCLIPLQCFLPCKD